MNQNTEQHNPKLRLIISPDYIELDDPRAPLIVRDLLKDPVARGEFLDFLVGQAMQKQHGVRDAKPLGRLEMERNLSDCERLLESNSSQLGQMNWRGYVLRYLQWRCEKRLISCASSMLALPQEEVAAKYKEFSIKSGGRSDDEFYEWIYAEVERNRASHEDQ